MSPLFWSFILLGVGLVIIGLELFIPSAGVLGILAGLLIVSGIVCGFMYSLQAGALILLGTAIALPILIVILLKAWPHTPIGRRILLDDTTSDQLLPDNPYSEDLVGQLGIAKTKMLPSGIIIVNHQKLDAISNGFPIEPGQAVKIIAIRGNRIQVEPYEGESGDVHELPARDRDALSQPFEDLELDS